MIAADSHRPPPRGRHTAHHRNARTPSICAATLLGAWKEPLRHHHRYRPMPYEKVLPVSIAHLPANHRTELARMFHRRRTAWQRMEPLQDGQKDPMRTPFKPTMNPATIVEIALRGGQLTREQYRAAWRTYPEHRPMLDALAAVQHAGWPA